MKISTMVTIQRSVVRLLLLPLMLFLLEADVYSQEKRAQEVKVQNPRWASVGGVVIITYDLTADPEMEYDLAITLRRDSDKNFKVVPRSVTGAVGKGKFAGAKREIRWEYRKDVSQGLSGDDYYFEFSVSPIQPAKGTGFLTYAAIVGGIGAVAVAAVLVLSGSKTSTSQLPEPPKLR